VVEPLDAGVVVADVVRRPADAELVAAGGELADEVGEVAVVGIAPASERRIATVSVATLSQSE
jgi:hypothetical protein